ncbi:enoyl-CoA hydratase/isomerase family protein [Mycolicibacterium fallax]|uniref:Enoyl-CoA hydratase n=1 Tax=Mycolicibacterium fallax TaxID=1793 RepID=A0A1X1R045_MYCFA|nr:enoyl-CoA hydratase/isomerase family protein [Mycolicibacterium fallax]ORU97264.1 enoyl-CoA hydratase [Mycolicibacterium fallax]BBY97843.1 enoyl-CoA hydratase [Mycolicibacterium fallax]HOW93890.1 enoyl-CoA hydratase/isomerase family protein [Mycolicibacterium fallax]HSA41363.1 enoyl-CoA hydratase/isomerase family protein [Mycobacterium sp.]
MEYQTLLFEPGTITRITLNRPNAANGLDDVLCAELADAAARCSEAKVVLLTGSGRFFCAGGDLRAMAASPLGPGAFVKGIADDLHTAMQIFARMDAVLITAVNGTAAGAGFSLAVSGDLVLADESASFTMAYTRAGLSPDGGSSYLLPRLVGLRRAQELILTNRTLSAAEALDWGLVTEVAADLPARADQLAAEIVAGSGTANGAVKRLLRETYRNDYAEQLALEAALIAANADAADGKEGIDAFLNKRSPQFG